MSFIAVGGSLALGSAITGGTIAAGAGLALAAGNTINGINSSRKTASAASDAIAQQRQLADNLKYTPINIDQLKADASKAAVENATASLALERSLQPDIAAARAKLATTVSGDLSRGGALSPDVANQVARAARTSGSLSGALPGPLTAASIGLTAEQLKQSRISNANNLLLSNPLPTAGLDPGSLASEEVAQNAAMNQFNLSKAGVSSNLINSALNARAAGAGADASQTGSLLALLGKIPSLFTGGAPTSSPTAPAGSATFAAPAGVLAGIPGYSLNDAYAPKGG